PDLALLRLPGREAEVEPPPSAPLGTRFALLLPHVADGLPREGARLASLTVSKREHEGVHDGLGAFRLLDLVRGMGVPRLDLLPPSNPLLDVGDENPLGLRGGRFAQQPAE